LATVDYVVTQGSRRYITINICSILYATDKVKQCRGERALLTTDWAMKRKRRIAPREIYKWKACLNIGGHMQQYGVHYWETYSPVVRWTTIRLCLVLAMINGWSTRQLNFVQAYPQAKLSTRSGSVRLFNMEDFHHNIANCLTKHHLAKIMIHRKYQKSL
jgi:Reverse transcriptase (RNA-dependent DNA polymerase)